MYPVYIEKEKAVHLVGEKTIVKRQVIDSLEVRITYKQYNTYKDKMVTYNVVESTALWNLLYWGITVILLWLLGLAIRGLLSWFECSQSYKTCWYEKTAQERRQEKQAADARDKARADYYKDQRK